MSDHQACRVCKGEGITKWVREHSHKGEKLDAPVQGVRKCRRCKGTKIEPQRA